MILFQFDDIQHELDIVRANSRDMEKKQRKFDQMLAEERAIVAKTAAERDAAAQESRDRETKYLGVVKVGSGHHKFICDFQEDCRGSGSRGRAFEL